MTPHQGNTVLFRSFQQLPCLRLGPSTRLVRCFQNYRDTDTVGCAALGAEVPGLRQQQLKQTLIARFLKTHFFHLSLILKSHQNRIELVTRPG